MLKEKDWRKRRAGKENEFYTKVNNGGIIKKRMPDIAEIKQNIDAAQRRAEAFENEWLDSVFHNADSRQVSAAKARAQEAKGSVKSWNEKLSEAYGLGENGYWNRSTGQPKTQQSAQMRANPAHAYAAGNGRPAQTASTKPAQPKTQQSAQMRTNPAHAYAAGNGRPAQTASTTPAQPKTQQSAQMRTNPGHAYGIGQFGTKAEQPKPTIVPGAAGSAKGREIMQLQDTLVHNPGMSDREKNQVQEKISSLAAEKEVLDWKDANPGTPTVENYEAQKSYYDRLWQQNQDAIVNGLGNGTLEQGSDEWYALFKKGDDLLAMKDAYNRGMMGQLDGQKAQAAEEQRVSDSYYQGMMNAYGNIGEGITAEQERKLADEKEHEEYPLKPIPAPMPGPPPSVEDLGEYLDEQEEYWEDVDWWESEVDRIDINNGKVDVPAALKNMIENDEIEGPLVKDCAKMILDYIENESNFSGERGVYSGEFDNVSGKVDNVSVEIEIMDDRRLGIYGGDFTTDQDIVMALMEEVNPISNIFELFTATAQLFDPDYNPGAILKPGDVRINIGAGKDYFFRDGKFLFSETYGLNDVTWGEYGKKMNEVYRESGQNWKKLIRSIPFVDLIKSIN